MERGPFVGQAVVAAILPIQGTAENEKLDLIGYLESL